MWIGSPIWTTLESASRSTGKLSPATFRIARSRAEGAPGSALTGGLYFFTSALRLKPLEASTKTWGWSVTLVVGSTRSSSLRLMASSTSGRSPGLMPCRSSAFGRHATLTARWACWFTSQRGVS
jgi:hypothetical protein